MRLGKSQIQFIVAFIVAFTAGYLVSSYVRTTLKQGFQVGGTGASCVACGAVCPASSECPPIPDLSKQVLKSSIPPCPSMPDLSQQMLKTECPPVPDLSQQVLKSSIPKPQPIIVDSSSCKGGNCGECPPCPRPRCPEVKCPPPTVCPAPPPCPRPVCPETVVKCKAEETSQTPVRPFLAPLSFAGFGST